MIGTKAKTVESRQSGEISIERSIHVAAPAATVFELINDLRSWERWNPNGRGDPKIERTYGGAQSGEGAIASWRGSRSGAGVMEITCAIAPSEVTVMVKFERPFKVTNVNQFVLRPDDLGTKVTWSMRGPKPTIARLMGLVFNMDRVMEKHFEDGLTALKASAEAG
jgi:uncharacterized protein YndB with AHSA1/START domain